MNAQLIWKETSPRCKYIFEPSDDRVSKIYCTIENYQEKYKELCETLQVALNQNKLKGDVCCKCATKLRAPNVNTLDHEDMEWDAIAGGSSANGIDASTIACRQEMEAAESIEDLEAAGYATGVTSTNITVSRLVKF